MSTLDERLRALINEYCESRGRLHEMSEREFAQRAAAIGAAEAYEDAARIAESKRHPVTAGAIRRARATASKPREGE